MKNTVKKRNGIDLWLYIIIALVMYLSWHTINTASVSGSYHSNLISDTGWQMPSLLTDRQLKGEERRKVIYGQELVAHTAKYLGPQGSVAQSSNGLNCQNCHLNAGRKMWGNNYSAVASTYPRFSQRSGAMESIFARINGCFERSLNGKALDSSSNEMQAMIAYIQWVGQNVPKDTRPAGVGINALPYLERAADPIRGGKVYISQCQRCHGNNGEGQKEPGNPEHIYPPLWGAGSYNTGAGLYRLSRFAGYVLDNMPYEIATHNSPQLSVEDAWDVAAFVNSQPRPEKDVSADWPDISRKPVDHPFGPYHDGFSERQHKYGPFKPIKDVREMLAVKKAAP